MMRDYHILGACSCWGAQIKACEKGPLDLVSGNVFGRLIAEGAPIGIVDMLYPSVQASQSQLPTQDLLSVIHDFNIQLMHRVDRVVHAGAVPVVIGGDHANAVGTWNGISPPFGLLWIDAHMDAHTPSSSPSGAYHGMPLASLLGYGPVELAKIRHPTPVLQPKHLALIGVRSFEEEEAALLDALDVRIYFMDEVKNRGLPAILPEAVTHVTQGVKRYGVSIDIDVFAIDDAPGVGSPEDGGFSFEEFRPFISRFSADPRWVGIEIVEFNPERDVEHRTRELIYEMLRELML